MKDIPQAKGCGTRAQEAGLAHSDRIFKQLLRRRRRASGGNDYGARARAQQHTNEGETLAREIERVMHIAARVGCHGSAAVTAQAARDEI